MKKAVKILIYTLTILLVACTSRRDYGALLRQADSLLASQPDSALAILDSIPLDKLETDADSAYYALLMTQARDRNYVPQADDSLIQAAVRYYDQHSNAAMQARAYYLWGSFYRDQNEQAKAVERYLLAAIFAEKVKNKELLGRIYINASYLYFWQKLYKETDSICQKAEQMGIQLHDTSLHIEALLMQGKAKLKQNDYLQAEKKLLQAKDMSENFKSNELYANIIRTLSLLYSHTKDKVKALKYAKQNISLQKDTAHCYYAFFTLGEAYFQTGQYDLATHYMYKCLGTPDYGIKEDAYMRLADIAKMQGDSDFSLDMEISRSHCRDSIEGASQRSEILKVEQKINAQIQQARYKEMLNKRIVAVVVSILIGGAIIFLWLYQKHRKQECEQLMREAELRRKHIIQEELFVQKETEIKILQDQIARQYSNEKKRQALETELANLHEQYTNSIKKVRKYSDVIQKIDNILAIYKEKKIPKEFLDEDDWARLLAEIDNKGIVNHICDIHGLSQIECHLCTLLLLDYSVTDMGRIIQRNRVSIYRIEHSILNKMGKEYQVGELQKLLKNRISGYEDK